MASLNPTKFRLLRQLAALLAVAFALLAVVSPAFHVHSQPGKVSAHHIAVGVPCGSAADVDCAGARDGHRTHSLVAVDPCFLCDWLTGEVPAAAPAPVLLAISLSAAAALLVAVRVAALCERPLPRRGLRAPPVLLAA